MIKLHFSFAGELIIIKIDGTNLSFSSTMTNLDHFYPIDNLRLDPNGIVQEHPDLKDKPVGEMRLIAMNRLKEHLKTLGSEYKIEDYLIDELTKKGYKLEIIRRDGFRPRKK